ncbi:LysR family transcriptional regulator [Alkalimarinus alittae]|uniref:LysR family transcriptional regulator n=1 Tax=Alkalimarinus alittae TaxID=2961619 RepID=A0ABY6N1N4_9ALTE|nr:LysR family transcriptional regulator [Alkalimarinus alittae]UZE95986.1 LysR family transcriptional regulator [Alkalimarinus alittae]
MDLKALGYFVAVVEKGSITAAAEACFVAQPSISHAINKLEGELQVPLFTRQPRGVKVTEEGHVFYREAKGLLNHARSVQSLFKNRAQNGLLTVSVARSIAFAYLNELLSQLKRIDSLLDVRLIHQTEQADIRLTVERDASVDDVFIPLWQDQYCLIIPAENSLAYKHPISLDDLDGQSIIERVYCDRSAEWTEFLRTNEISVNVAASVDNEEWALSLVEAGVGVAIVPLPQTADYSHRFVVKALSEVVGMHSIRRTVGVAIPIKNLENPSIKGVKQGLVKVSMSE